ncbi:MAG: hypothetical protein HY720_09780 [Planctomycetes bacterium]|nr:hypothetical protein [Planctomycetota bacterium]
MRSPRFAVLSAVLALSCLPALAQQASPVTLQVKAPPFGYLGKPIIVRFEVAFSGPGTARQVQVVYPIPDIFAFRGQQGGVQNDDVNRRAVWQVGTLTPGQSATAEITLVGLRQGQVSPCAEISYLIVDQQCPPLEVRAVPALHVTMKDEPDPIEAGQETTYTYYALNQGEADVEDLAIEVDVPEEMEFLEAQAPAGMTFQMTERTVVFSTVPRLAPRQQLEFRMRVRSVRAGDVVASCRARFKGFSKPVLVQEGTTVYQP